MLKQTEATHIRHPLIELTSVRDEGFLRETAGALLGVRDFRLLLALALGFAFRSKPPEQDPGRRGARCRPRSNGRLRCRNRRHYCRASTANGKAAKRCAVERSRF